MSSGYHFLDIVFFAMIAAFLVLRLRSVLGRRSDSETPPHEWGPPPAQRPLGDNVVDITGMRKPAPEPALEGPAAAGLAAIRGADRTFSPETFLAGAQAAFQMIVAAFAAGDTRTLRPLLSDEVYRNFAQAIDARMRAGERLETELVAIRSATVTEARLTGSVAHVTVRFVSDQVNVVHDAADQVVEGQPGQAAEVIDEWTFRRDVSTNNPNWELVATRSPEA
jgi:predicted lipid-binding transport protein (Tim44 family)